MRAAIPVSGLQDGGDRAILQHFVQFHGDELGEAALARLQLAEILEVVVSWSAFDERYRDLILRYCRRNGLQPSDAEDVRQMVMLNLAKQLRSFQYDVKKGRFRHSLGLAARKAWASPSSVWGAFRSCSKELRARLAWISAAFSAFRSRSTRAKINWERAVMSAGSACFSRSILSANSASSRAAVSSRRRCPSWRAIQRQPPGP
jgi:hypothetical protein